MAPSPNLSHGHFMPGVGSRKIPRALTHQAKIPVKTQGSELPLG